MLMEYNIYCDESSITNCRYMLIGGLWIPWYAEASLRETLTNVRVKHRLSAEMRWKKVHRSKLCAYHDFADAFMCASHVTFKCIVIDTHIVKWKTYHGNDKDLGFYKFYYQVISRNLHPNNLYWLYPDDRQNRHADSLSLLQYHVNQYWRDRGARYNMLQAVEPRDSKNDDLLQLADIILGAIASEWNQDTTRPAKLSFAQSIKDGVGCASLGAATPLTHKINIWQWKPYKEVAG